MSSCAECTHHGKWLAGHRHGMKWPCSHCDNGDLLDTDKAEPNGSELESLRTDLATAITALVDIRQAGRRVVKNAVLHPYPIKPGTQLCGTREGWLSTMGDMDELKQNCTLATTALAAIRALKP